MVTMHSLTTFVGVAMALSGLLATPVAATDPKAEEVLGGWFGELPCPFTSVVPSLSSPTIIPFECVSGSTWDGGWAGHTVYRAVGTLDLVSGDIHATVDETLVGVVAATQESGTLQLVGTVDIDGATGTFLARERIVGGTGAFEGSAGTVDFEGFQAAAVVGHGGYHGTWAHP